MAAKSNRNDLTVSWIHIPSSTCPPNPRPLKGAQVFILGSNLNMQAAEADSDEINDDRRGVLNAVLDADALIFATPVYSHSPAGALKGFLDKILGSFTDASFARRTLERQQAGDPMFAAHKIDARLLKPRVVGFIAVAGSTTPDRVSLALPVLHLLVYCLHAKVVDQEDLMGYGYPGIVVAKDNGAAIARAQQIGRNVASQIGKPFDEAQYLGPEPFGACPYCHLAKFELLSKDNKIGCVTCGALGKLEVDKNGGVMPVWETDSQICSITLAGKYRHLDDLINNGRVEMKAIASDAEFEKKRDHWRSIEVPVVPLSSMASR
ncbi:uncharacterized protein Z518_05754 [Rhinocladiella mackenziei CBS 650.93]|uniref:NADPH-dependent FMN reductase-like domain-containing protein n=1 Tax=Rhinocladiella mackenziei CBS 650.93 TaxID=1442369 RepID=A0A0D2H377_9EURO|nr:uncharacterized protein Z518_05754 [Rhinocladiella mackenziei CBS 650.93]KIX04883.1 hypothetical protein Z518_05754 [Rhinocladiella mackenziei CBS 650.93]